MAFNENGNVKEWREQIAQQEERLTDIEDLVSTMNSAIANIRQAEIEANGAEKAAEESAKEAYMAVSEANAAKSNSIVYMVEENGQENEQEASRLVLLAEEKANIAKQKSMEANEKREAVQRQKKQIIDAYEKAQAILNEKKNELEETENAMLEWNKNMEKAKEEVEEADKEAQAAALEANDARKNSVVYMIDESEEENEQKAYNLALIAEEKATIAKQKRSKLESINNKSNNFEDKMKNINNDIQKLTDMLNRVAPIINGEKPNVQPTKPDNEKKQKSVVKPGNGTETERNTGVNGRPGADEKPRAGETQEEQLNISIILNPKQIDEYAEEIYQRLTKEDKEKIIGWAGMNLESIIKKIGDIEKWKILDENTQEQIREQVHNKCRREKKPPTPTQTSKEPDGTGSNTELAPIPGQEPEQGNEEQKQLNRLHIIINVTGSQVDIYRGKGTATEIDWANDHKDDGITPLDAEISEKIKPIGKLKEIYENALEIGDKFVAREILKAAYDKRISGEEAMKQLQTYINVLKGEETTPEAIEQLNIAYDLRGIRKSGLDKEKRKELKQNAKKIRDLSKNGINIGTVKAPWYTKLKWSLQDRFGRKNALNAAETPKLGTGREGETDQDNTGETWKLTKEEIEKMQEEQNKADNRKNGYVDLHGEYQGPPQGNDEPTSAPTSSPTTPGGDER